MREAVRIAVTWVPFYSLMGVSTKPKRIKIENNEIFLLPYGSFAIAVIVRASYDPNAAFYSLMGVSGS